MIPLFSSHWSLGKSILTLEKAGKSKLTEADSILDLCINNKIQDLYLVDETISSFPEAYEAALDANLNLRYGIKITCCSDIKDKSEESLKTNSKIVIWAKNTQGYYDLIKIWSLAATEGKYYEPRICWNSLKDLWTNNFLLSIPFYDSFLFKNNLENYRCIPSLEFTEPTFFLESNDLPFDELMREIVENYTKDKYQTQEVKSIFYAKKEDMTAYTTFRCISKRSTLQKPNLDHFSSDTFCLESYLEKV